MFWVFNQSPKTLQAGGPSPINFNYGRANTNFEPNKRYKVDPELFDFSFGFPMQDHGNNGDVSMLYGIDKRASGTLNDTDVGVAQYMVEQSEIPYARGIPIRTLYAQMKDSIPNQSAYGDSWHMSGNLNIAIGAYMFTILNGTCVLGEEPENQDSNDWKSWMSHKIGYETAWNLMYLEGSTPECSALIDSDGDGYNSYVDCDDNNESINPDQTEIIYNGLDDDCNNSTLDDDLDQDGYMLAEDCDDNNQSINPGQAEEPYNGFDDDCDTLTLDDDLDQDGFLLAEDCDDTNPTINPEAAEIANNGIDEDCDGMDLISSIHDLGNGSINIFPNPTIDEINIEINDILQFETSLYNVKGQLIVHSINEKKIFVNSIPGGMYFLEIKDLKSGQKIIEKIVINKKE